MKKLMVLLLMATMLFALAACSEKTEQSAGQGFLAQTQSSAETKGESSGATEGQTNRDAEIFDGDILLARQSVLTLHMTINPEFVLFIDVNGTVCSVRCLNEDAEALFTELDVLGMDMESGISAVLEAACEQEFLNKTTGEISVVPTVHNGLDWTPALGEAIDQLIPTVEKEKGIDAAVIVETPEITDTNGIFDTDVTGCTTNKYTTEYGGDAVEYLDENGTIVHMVIDYSGLSTETYYYENGRMTLCLVEDIEGGYGRRVYDENECARYEIFTYADGSYSEIVSYASGNTEKYIWLKPDGYYHEYHYADNATIVDGRYYDGTTLYTKEGRPDGSYWEQYNYENGCAEIYIALSSNGRYEEWHYADDGYAEGDAYHFGHQTYAYIDDPETGEFREAYFDVVTGEKISDSYRNPDGWYGEYTTYENGNTATDIYGNTETGVYGETIYYENGNVKSFVREDPTTGEYSENRFDENGELLYLESAHGDGSYNMVEYYSPGMVKHQIQEDANGRREVIYDENGDETYYYSSDATTTIEYSSDGTFVYIKDGVQVTDENELMQLKMAMGFD